MTAERLIIGGWTLLWAVGLFAAVLVSERRAAIARRTSARATAERVPDPVRCTLVPAPSVAGPRAAPRRGPATGPLGLVRDDQWPGQYRMGSR
ncbi:MAG: hypothetical protein JWP11_1319 [Frankiales bacterium]|nr:hypothetical protein [Frankiales bacterium]